MRRTLLNLILLAIPTSASAQVPHDSQVPARPATPAVPSVPLLCSSLKSWHISLTTIVVKRTPNDPGSHEEWTVNFILFGDGPLSSGSSFQAHDFDMNPH